MPAPDPALLFHQRPAQLGFLTPDRALSDDVRDVDLEALVAGDREARPFGPTGDERVKFVDADRGAAVPRVPFLDQRVPTARLRVPDVAALEVAEEAHD